MQRFVLFFGALLLSIIGAYAQNSDEVDAIIAYYTDIIEQRQPNDFDSVTAYHGRSAAYAAKGEFDRAIADVSHIIHVLPGLTWPYGERATLYFAKKEYHQAIKDFTTAILMDHSDEHDDYRRPELQFNPRREYEYYNDRGVSYMEIGEYDKSIADLTKSINLKQNNALAYYNRARAHKRKGEHDLAAADYSFSIGLDAKIKTLPPP
jgi:tetratricopeptide (TPR) repeat protein